jgi:hypothetical protein
MSAPCWHGKENCRPNERGADGNQLARAVVMMRDGSAASCSQRRRRCDPWRCRTPPNRSAMTSCSRAEPVARPFVQIRTRVARAGRARARRPSSRPGKPRDEDTEGGSQPADKTIQKHFQTFSEPLCDFRPGLQQCFHMPPPTSVAAKYEDWPRALAVL